MREEHSKVQRFDPLVILHGLVENLLGRLCNLL